MNVGITIEIINFPQKFHRFLKGKNQLSYGKYRLPL